MQPYDQPAGLARAARALRLLAVNVGSSQAWVPKRLRRQILRLSGYTIGRRVDFFPGSVIRCEKLTVGEGCFVNGGANFGDGEITIGDRVFIGPNVVLASASHQLGPAGQRAGRNVHTPIVIEDGVWIGSAAVILGDVTVARGCVVAAGAVVHQSTEPDGLYAGVPARRVRDLPADGECSVQPNV